MQGIIKSIGALSIAYCWLILKPLIYARKNQINRSSLNCMLLADIETFEVRHLGRPFSISFEVCSFFYNIFFFKGSDFKFFSYIH
ncbi:unnamed protein product, partial [Vitis vinifera]|uniref:Uncharacterized protein n=1 Tax=Vitis vinifera TaxID=29760 RepID=D7TT37_VITVI